MKYIVYQTINLVNNKIYIGVHKTENPEVFDGYIGCGVNILHPYSYSRPTTAFQFAVKKYGTSNFKRTVLRIFDTKEEALELEKQIVTREFINRRDTYNMICGGIDSPTNEIAVYQFNTSGNLIKKWNSAAEACTFLNVSHTSILNAMKYKESCKKFFWSRNKTINIKEYSLNIGTVCYKYNGNTGKLEQTYNSLSEAAKDNNLMLLHVERSVHGGFILKGNYYSTTLYEEFKGNPKLQLRNNFLYVYDLDGNYITKLKGIKNICAFFNIKSNCSIYTAIRCNKPYKQYQLSLEYKEKLSPVKNLKNINKPVICYDQKGNIIEEFDSMTKAVNKYGTGVQRVLKGQQQICKGFIFKYKSL